LPNYDLNTKIHEVGPIDPYRYSMAIQCKHGRVELCRSHDFSIELEYNRLVPSSKYGVDVIREKNEVEI